MRDGELCPECSGLLREAGRERPQSRDAMETLACDAALEFHGEPPSYTAGGREGAEFDVWWTSYPGW